jgi:hypothetical protein
MTDYRDLFHDMIIESQGVAYADRSGQTNPISAAYNDGTRHGTILGITLGYRTMAEAGHIPMEIYEKWHEFAYSAEMDDPQTLRDVIMRKRSEE